jgi:hypothetical protein
MSTQSSVIIQKFRGNFPFTSPLKCSGKKDCCCPECEKNQFGKKIDNEIRLPVATDSVGFISI